MNPFTLAFYHAVAAFEPLLSAAAWYAIQKKSLLQDDAANRGAISR